MATLWIDELVTLRKRRPKTYGIKAHVIDLQSILQANWVASSVLHLALVIAPVLVHDLQGAPGGMCLHLNQSPFLECW